MIRDVEFWREWEARGPLAEPVGVERNFRIFDALLAHARALGRFPPADPIEGLDEKIRWVRAMHGFSDPGQPGR